MHKGLLYLRFFQFRTIPVVAVLGVGLVDHSNAS